MNGLTLGTCSITILEIIKKNFFLGKNLKISFLIKFIPFFLLFLVIISTPVKSNLGFFLYRYFNSKPVPHPRSKILPSFFDLMNMRIFLKNG